MHNVFKITIWIKLDLCVQLSCTNISVAVALRRKTIVRATSGSILLLWILPKISASRYYFPKQMYHLISADDF